VITLVSADALCGAMAVDIQEYTIVDARPRDDFLRGHIPGALSVQWERWCAVPPSGAAPVLSQPGYWGALADASPAWYAEHLSRCGVASARPILVYADGLSSKGREGRIAWMLLYLGARHVALLDGGWSEWRRLGGAVAAGDEPARPERFAVALQEERRWTRTRLTTAHRRRRVPTLVDTRTAPEFDGDCYDYLPRKGRLPDAILFPFSALFAGPQRYVGRATYQARLPADLQSEGAETSPAPRVVGSRLVAYCEVGVRASLMALVHEAYTGEVVGVFDGSLIEWALYADLPVDGPATS